MSDSPDLMLDSPVDGSIKAILEDAILPVGKFADGKSIDDARDEWSTLEAQAAFLGPTLWDKNSGFENEIQLGDQYMDLDEFLNASCIGESQQSNASSSSVKSEENTMSSMPMKTDVTEEAEDDPEHPDEDELSDPPSPASSMSSNDSDDSYHPPPAKRGRRAKANVDYRTMALIDDDLKPAQMVKKSRKQFVPDEKKDDKYWARRRKNNLAAKRSRDARRAKENQIVVRAGFLEKENQTLKDENEKLKKENKKLKAELAKYKK